MGRRVGGPELRGADLRDDVSTPMPADGWVEVNGLRLHYLDWGGAGLPPVLFLHGGSAHAHWWDFAIPPPPPNAFAASRSICAGTATAAAPPTATTAWPRTRPTSARSSARSDLGGGGVVGHSFGGWVAMVYAGRAGGAVGALAILDSRPHIGVRSARMLEALRKLPHTRYASHDDAITRFRLLPAATRADAAVVAHVAAHGVIREADGTFLPRFDRRALAGAGAQDLTPHLRAARCPILAVRAALSEIVDAAACQPIAPRCPTPSSRRSPTRIITSCSTSRPRSPTWSATSSDDTSTALAPDGAAMLI